jgi:hypothetical protein
MAALMAEAPTLFAMRLASVLALITMRVIFQF